jgi:LPXTG-motif cell wall-anchored protein
MEIFKYTGTLGAGGSAISVPGAQFTLEWEDPGDTYNPDRIIGYDNSTGVPVPIYYRGDNYKEDYYEVLPVPPDTKTRYYTVFEYIGPTATGDAEYRVVPFADVLSLAAANGTAVADELEFPPLPSGEYGKQPPPTQPYTTILTAPKDGKIYIVGLDAGDYLLKEIYTPSPFNLLDDPVEVNIEHVLQYDTTNPLNPIFYAGLQGLRTVSLTNVPSPNLPPITEENTNPTGGVAVGNGRINIQNNSGLMFPMTGGIGTAIFILVGILLMSSAVIALVIRRRMRITAEITKQQL